MKWLFPLDSNRIQFKKKVWHCQQCTYSRNNEKSGLCIHAISLCVSLPSGSGIVRVQPLPWTLLQFYFLKFFLHLPVILITQNTFCDLFFNLLVSVSCMCSVKCLELEFCVVIIQCFKFRYTVDEYLNGLPRKFT